MNTKQVHFLKKTLRILLWCVGSIIALLLLLVILIQVPAIQNYVKNKAVTYLQEKIKTKVTLDYISIKFPKDIVLEGFYFEDQKKDTLLSGKRLEVDVDLFKLISSELEINSVSLENVNANISRNKDGVFNFDYIIKAFESKEPKDPNSEPFKISVVKVNLDNIKFNFKDDFSNNDMRVKLTHFDTKFKKFDLDKMDFNIPNINLNGLKLILNQDAVEKIAEVSVKTVDTISKRKDFKLKLKKISLSKIDISYDNKDSKLDSGIRLGNLDLAVNEIDLNKQLLDFDSFELKNLRGNLRLEAKDKQIETPDLDSTAIKQTGWKVKLNNVDIQNTAFKFDDMQSKPNPKGIDYSHLDLDKFNFKAEKLYYGNDTISGNIKSLAVNEKSGLQVQALKTNFFYGPKNAELNNLYLRTPQTLLQNKIKIGYPSLASLKKNSENLTIDANLNQSKIGFKDILLFAPDLQKTNPFKSNPNVIVYLNTRLNGKIKNLNIPLFEMSGIGNTKVSMSGKITGLPNAQKAFYNLNIKKLSSTSKDVYSFVPAGTIPKNIQLPSQFNLQGKFKGSVQNFKTNLALNSSFGNAKIDALFDQRIKKKEKYDAMVYLQDFDLGRLIKNDSIGKITLKAKVKGKGLDPKTAQANLDGIVQKAVFNRYAYRNLTLKGNIENGSFAVKSGMKDPNLNFDLTANGNTKDKYPSIQLKLNLDIADLEKLNLHAGPMKLRGNIDADIANSNPDFLNGKVFLSNIQILQNELIVLDSVRVIAFSDNTRNNIKITSQFLKAEVDGKYKLTTLASAIKKSLSKYMDLQNPKVNAESDEQRLAFTLAIDNDPILFKLIPKLTGLEPINITGKYNNRTDSLEIKGTIPRIVYANNTIADGKINIEAKENALEYQISVATIESGELKIPFTSLSGKVENNVLSYALQVKDTKDKEQYVIAGEFLRQDAKNILKIDSETFVLNYEKWNIDPENAIEFGDKRLYVNKFFLDNSGNELKIQSQGTQNNAPIQIDFVNFKIETILNIVKKDKLLMQGLINGNAVVENVMTSPIFTSDIKIKDFAFKAEPVGDIAIKVDNKTANTLVANVVLSGEENDVNINGNYRISDGNLDFNADINKLNIKSIQGFSMGNVTDGTGFLSGNFKITGNVRTPKVAGELNFNDSSFRITKLNSYFKTENEKITFSNDIITFDKFTLYDKNDNELALNGTIQSPDFRNYNFNLTVIADDFRAIHSKATDNDLFYGDLFFDTKLDVNGTLENPVIGGNIKINKETKFTVVLPQSDPSIADREGIVEFVNEDNLYLKQTVQMEKKLNQSELIGMNVSVDILLDKEAELTLIIDKGNGDYLNLKGEAQLTGGIDPSGKTTLTGKYEVSDGAYEMSFNAIRRKFDIQKGSYIIWNGEPTMATLNITAIYKVDAAPIDLLGNQLGADVSATVKNTYKQKIPFQTLLKMNGELLKPEITFDIKLPDGNYGVSSDIVSASQTKLEQLRQEPAELNKQVFALLLLNRFVGENPFASESGGTNAESLARQSVSKILSQQLNDLSAELITGVQVEFDLEATEDYTSGSMENRTDLNVAFSKQLLDDRLKVTVGSSFGVEGKERANEETTNIAGDVSLDYQLTRDGRYMVRAYRKNEYQVAVEGQVIETGVAFVITMSYNKFRELFHRTETEKEIIKEEKERKEKRKRIKKQENKFEKQIEGNEQRT